MQTYQDRIYQAYVESRNAPFIPLAIGDLKSMAPYLEKLIREHFPSEKNASILDIGCGNGALLHFARLAGYLNLSGVDRSPQQVSQAALLGVDLVREGDFFQVLESTEHESLDVVIAFDVLEHFSKNEVFAVADHVSRVLRRGGKWIIHVPNAESPFFGRIRYGDITHELAFTSESIAQLLKTTGFSSLACYEDAPIPHGIKSMARLVLWKVFRSILNMYLTVETGAVLGSNCILSQNFLIVGVK